MKSPEVTSPRARDGMWNLELEGVFIGLELERHEQSLLRVD